MSVTTPYGTEKVRIAYDELDPFGAAQVLSYGSAPPEMNLRLPGQYHDAETGLYNNWHRYYNPQWGRYLSPDPLPSLQPFAYAKNNPVKFVDRSGLWWDYVADGVGLGYDIYVIKTEGASFKNVATFLVDVVLAAAPFIPSIGGLKALGKTASHGDEVVKLGKAASHGDEIVKGAEAIASRGGFRSFSSLKRALGPAGKGKQWHHIVEQSQVGKFGAEAIHNVDNVVAIPTDIHRKISGFYSSKPDFAGGKRVREWLRGQSFEQQREFGLKVLRRFGVEP